jgi:hypothetical protein
MDTGYERNLLISPHILVSRISSLLLDLLFGLRSRLICHKVSVLLRFRFFVRTDCITDLSDLFLQLSFVRSFAVNFQYSVHNCSNCMFLWIFSLTGLDSLAIEREGAMANRMKEQEKNEKIIRGLLKLPANKRCINCNNLVMSHKYQYNC